MKALISVYAFMLIPIWIPLIGAFVGHVDGLLRRDRGARVRPVRGRPEAASAITS